MISGHSKKKFTILAADDDARQLSLNSSALRNRGYSVLQATSRDECFELAAEQKPDVLLLGPKLSGITSMEILRQVKAKAELSDILVVLIFDPESTTGGNQRASGSEPDGRLMRPHSIDDLLGCMHSMERIRQAEERLRDMQEMFDRRVRERTAQLEVINDALQKEIAERQRSEERVTTSEVFFREVTENSSDMIIILNKRGVLTYVSPSVERFLGYLPEEMMGKASFRFIHRDDLERAMLDFSEAVQLKEIAIPNSFRVRHKDGSERLLEGLGKNLLKNPVISGFIMNVQDVTERRRIEEATRLFAHTLESIAELVTITDLEDRFTYVNKAFLDAYGYSREEILGQHVGVLWSPNNSDGLLIEILEQNRTQNWHGELLNRAKNGREFPISLHTSRIRNEKGEVVGLVGISQDITERKKAETRLRDSEAKYRDLVEQINEVIFSTDIEGKFTYISPTAEHLSGYKPEEMLGHSIAEFIDTQFLPMVQARYQNPDPGNLEPIEYRVKVKSGDYRWVRSSSSTILVGGRPAGMRGVLADITAQKEAQETVTLLSHAVKSVAECVSITDHRNIILFVNQAFLSTYGYTEKEMIGKHISLVAPGGEIVANVLEKTLQGSWQGELVNRKKDGTEFPIFLSTSVVQDEQGNAIALVGVATDITERKKIERELDLQKKHLQESYERLKQLEMARDTLFHMIVHDMRSRLFVLMMGLEFLEKNELKNIVPPSRKVLVQALSTTTTLSQMVNALLDISKMESGEMKLRLNGSNLAELAERLVSFYELQRENRRFVIEAPSKGLQIDCDADLVLRVMHNLFSNALKFTPPDGAITIRIARVDGGARVSVEDTGTGISPAHLPRIFEKFYQAEAKESSTGLGLTFCKLAIELHGGSLGADSVVGKGSTFWFTLPEAHEGSSRDFD